MAVGIGALASFYPGRYTAGAVLGIAEGKRNRRSARSCCVTRSRQEQHAMQAPPASHFFSFPPRPITAGDGANTWRSSNSFAAVGSASVAFCIGAVRSRCHIVRKLPTRRIDDAVCRSVNSQKAIDDDSITSPLALTAWYVPSQPNDRQHHATRHSMPSMLGIDEVGRCALISIR